MSDTAPVPPTPVSCSSGEPVDELVVLESRVTTLGSALTIRRALPTRGHRMIGAWCFADHFGPLDFARPRDAMWVGAHPHIGLQTVTWLFEGEVLHRDSLGTVATIVPGGLNVMTAGAGISHTEETPTPNGGRLHGLQLWLALPSDHRHAAPSFQHIAELPTWRDRGAEATVFVGAGLEQSSPATVHTPLIGADIRLDAGTRQLPLSPEFEHGILVSEGVVRVDDRPLVPGQLAYLAPGRRSTQITSDGAARIALVGGEPFPEDILLWWNFVGRTHDEIRAAREDWLHTNRFGEVHGFDGDRLDIPTLEGRLKPT